MKKKLLISIVIYNEDINQINKSLDLFEKIECKKKILIFDNLGVNRENIFKRSNEYIYFNSDKNVGYGKGHNYSLKLKEDFDYQIVSNTDLFFDPSDLTKKINQISSDENFGIISPKIVNKKGDIFFNVREFPSILSLIIWKFNSQKIYKLLNYFFIDNRLIKNQIHANFVSGSFMIINFKIFKKVGGFDENFFLYLEDVDLCRRIKDISNIYYDPKIKITHFHEKSHSIKIKYLLISVISSLRYVYKWKFDKKRINYNKELVNTIKSL